MRYTQIKTPEVHDEYGECTDLSKKRTRRPQTLDNDDEHYLKPSPESDPPLYLGELRQKPEVFISIAWTIS